MVFGLQIFQLRFCVYAVLSSIHVPNSASFMSPDAGHWVQKTSSIKLSLSRVIGHQILSFVAIENVSVTQAIVIVEITTVE